MSVRVDPATGAFTILSQGQITSPNGIAFNTRYDALYVAGYSGEGTIYRIPIGPGGAPGPAEAWATDVGTGFLDGIAVDACDNVYIADFEGAGIYRIDPADRLPRLLVRSGFAYLPNLHWGSGLGGWSDTALYIPDGATHRVYAVDVRVPGIFPAFPRRVP